MDPLWFTPREFLLTISLKLQRFEMMYVEANRCCYCDWIEIDDVYYVRYIEYVIIKICITFGYLYIITSKRIVTEIVIVDYIRLW